MGISFSKYPYEYAAPYRNGVNKFLSYLGGLKARCETVVTAADVNDYNKKLFEAQNLKMKVELAVSVVGVAGALFFSYFALNALLKKMDPTNDAKKDSEAAAKRIMSKIGLSPDTKLTEYELCIASNLVDTSTIEVEWTDIGGLQNIIDEIKEVIILPFTRPDIFNSSGLLQPPKGVLLHGPPGCGKTMIAKATAKASGARFIYLQASVLYDKWYGESQKRAEAIFSLAHRIQPTIIFIDEIDAFLRSRGTDDHESTALIKAQFMSLWDGLATDKNSKVLIMGATNRPYDVDPAFRRRMPCQLLVGKPLLKDRQHVLRVLLRDEELDEKESVINEVATQTDGFSGSDLKEICRHAAIFRVRDYLEREAERGSGEDIPQLRKMNVSDFNKALQKFKNMSLTTTLHDAVDS